jgi:hypothetical protein
MLGVGDVSHHVLGRPFGPDQFVYDSGLGKAPTKGKFQERLSGR